MSKIFEIFTGHFVQLTLKKNLRQSISHGDRLQTVEQPNLIEGFLTEEDDDYFYLGLTPGEIHIAVSREDMSMMEFIDPSDIQDTLLNEMVDNKDIN